LNLKKLAAFVAAITLFVAAEAKSCESVQAIVAPSYAQAFVAQPVVAAPVVYQAQVFAQPVVAAYSAPVVQQVVVQKVRVHHAQQFRAPVRSALRGGRCR